MNIQIHGSGNPQTANALALSQRPATPLAVLEELFELLEDYAPSWYTQEHHDRAVEALLEYGSQSPALKDIESSDSKGPQGRA